MVPLSLSLSLHMHDITISTTNVYIYIYREREREIERERDEFTCIRFHIIAHACHTRVMVVMTSTSTTYSIRTIICMVHVYA